MMAQAKHHPGVPVGFQHLVKQMQNRVTELERQLKKSNDRIEALEKAAAPTQAPRRGRVKKDAPLDA